MPVSWDHKLIFIHIPKTGGTSIEQMFGMMKAGCLFSCTPIPGTCPDNRTPQHFTWPELKRHLSEDFIKSAFRFTFVRNPWDRFVSEYFWQLNMYETRFKPEGVPMPSRLLSLDHFCLTLHQDPVLRIRHPKGYDSHLEPQWWFLDEYGAIFMNFVGRYERFEADLRHVMEVAKVNLEIPHIHKAPRERDYRNYYSEFSRREVERFYHRDIDIFGYSFDG